MKLLLNVLNYQLIWLLCVLGGNQMVWLSLVLIGIHLFFSKQRRADLILIISVAVCGMLIDGGLKQLGLFSFPEDNPPIPYWLMTIWMALATLLNHSLDWLKDKPLIAALAGGIGGPLAYWGGARLGAAVFLCPLPQSLGVLALVWAIFTPLMLKASQQLNNMLPVDRK